MKVLEALEKLFPSWALKRKQADSFQRYYDAGYSSQYFKRNPGGNSSADSVVTTANLHLRAIARYLDENSSTGHGVLDTLEKKVIGSGLDLRLRIKNKNGKLNERLIRDIQELWWDFSQAPEVTRELSMPEMQRLAFRSACRDGEMLAHHVRGTNRIRAATQVPYAVELLEADYLPFETYAEKKRGNRVVQNSVEKDAWGRPVAYWLYKQHPGSGGSDYQWQDPEQKRVSADDMIHFKFVTRLRQTRGVTLLAPALRTLESEKDYQESELVAARVNAALTAMITKSTDFAQAPVDEQSGKRTIDMVPGAILDDLLPGEGVQMVGADRPNANMGEFLKTLSRNIASGTRTSYSNISKDYQSGTYSSQRQEMVESKIDYDTLRTQFINDFLNPIYREFLQTAMMANLIRIPSTVDRQTLLSPEWSAPPQPWIDPKKEADAWIAMHGAGLMSKSEIVEARGTDLNRLYTDLKMEQEIEEQLGLDMAQPQEQQETETQPADDPNDADDQAEVA